MNHPVTAGTRASALLARLEVVLTECQRLLVEPASSDDQLTALQLRREEAACLLAELEALVPPSAKDSRPSPRRRVL